MDGAWDNSANNFVEIPISANLVIDRLLGI